jgi:isopentenyl phosphate kinase
VRGRDAWIGYVQVAASAARLNRIVADALLDAGVPIVALRPSSSAGCRDGDLIYLETRPIRRALEERLVPLVHGDVALDEVRGGTIISTEEILSFLTHEFQPRRILLLGETDGVLDVSGPEGGTTRTTRAVISHITRDNFQTIVASLGRARGRDVTGGMLSKVSQMLDLVQRQPGLEAHIMSGREPGLLTRVLLEDDLPVGTRITAMSVSPP